MPFTGLIAEIPLGLSGLTGTINQSQIRPDQLITANNITYEAGTMQKEGGTAKYNATALTGAPSVLGGHDWDHDGGTQRQVVLASDGTLQKDDGAGSFSTTLKSGLSVGDVLPVFVEGGKEAAANDRKLFIFTAKNVVQVLAANGATTSDLTTPPADWSGTSQPSFGLNHEDRIWGGGNSNDPHRLYSSRTADHENFIDGDSVQISVFPGEGEKIVAAVSFKGVMIVFKFPSGIYVVDTTNVTVANWRVDRLTPKLGSVSALSAVVIDDDVLYMDQAANLHLISATREFGNFRSSALSDIADMGPFLRNNLNLGQLAKVQSVFYEAKREVHITVAGTGSTVNNRRLVVDFNRPDLPRFRFSDRDIAVSLWLKKDSNGVERLTMGDDAGFIFNLDQESRSNIGVGYNGEFRTANDDLSRLDPRFGTIRKEGRFLELVVEPKGDFDLSVDIYWDDEVTQTVQFNMGEGGSTLGTFVLGTDKLAGDKVLNVKKRITGGGRRFSMAGRNSGDAQDFSVARAFLHFKPSGESLI